MKKSLIALAVLSAFAGVASAQSSVTLSGGLDAGISRSSNATSLKGAASSRNNLTFSGVEDLGNGSSAFFTLNHRFNIQSGTQNGQNGSPAAATATQAAVAGNVVDKDPSLWRNAWVGLKNNDIGDVRLGRMLMPLQELNGGFEAWYGGDTVANVHSDGRGSNTAQSGLRTNEGTYLRTANFGGFVGHLGYGRKTGGSTQTDVVAPKGLGATFTFGPATLGAATDTNGNDKKSVGLYGKYNAGVAIVYAQFERSDANDLTATAKDKRISISADIPVGAFTFKVGYRNMNRDDLTGSAKKLGAGLEYALSPRTKLYSNLGKTSGADAEVVNNSATASAAAARKLSADIGVWHKF